MSNSSQSHSEAPSPAGSERPATDARPAKPPRIRVSKDGPYLVSGSVPLSKKTIGTNAKRESVAWLEDGPIEAPATYALCRCGHSATKPFCDGSHTRLGFDGSETADRAEYITRAQLYPGSAMSLSDDETLCAFARFCDPHGQIWSQPPATDDPSRAQQFVAQANACPGGRLVAWDNRTGKPIETHHDPEISVIEDPAEGVSGPLWVQGGITVEAGDGFVYERRNRVALCRCGQSQNKPFCDGTHASIGFKDGL
ncbi:CDGSH iron-sulfur domain-containing protein [Paracoccus aminophilus]|uniref:Zinc finger domain containing protein n=1 Tax=Paracoccus aminophilus JCM 7686 TaxID=1367847 RepID=S5XT34_PARAH|nr:CDGSH iron-sulfur domain-containing protein [Paracoccus aminophilus]AGT08312.1 zinc finger domain containing protein [Paracoccus aminophilus JCM 7686]